MEPIQTKIKRRFEAIYSQVKRIILGKGAGFSMDKITRYKDTRNKQISNYKLKILNLLALLVEKPKAFVFNLSILISNLFVSCFLSLVICKTKLSFKTLILLITFLTLSTFNQAQASSSMDISMFIMDKNTNKPLDGDQTVSFIIYEGEDGSEVWSESQSVRVSYGLLKTSLGEDNDLPEDLDPLNNDYYLGIKIGNDKELSPRKKISPNPFAISAISAQTLQGSKIGEDEGDIMLLGSGGKIDNDYLNTGEDDDNLVLGNDDRLHEQNSDTGTTEKTFTIGSETSLGSNNFTLAVGSSSSAPALRFNAGSDLWELSEDGGDYSQIISKDYLGEVDTSIVPGSSGLNLGTLDNQWENLYVRNLVIGSTSIAGTAANYLTINDDATDGEDSGIKFYRGSTLDTHSIIQWDDSEEYFSFYKNDTDLAGINVADITAAQLTVNGAVTMGATGETITAKSDIVPNESGMSLGSLANPWANVYTENFVIDTTSTTSEYFVINSDATDNQDSGLRFYRGPTLDTYATFHWDASETTLNFYQREDTTAFGTIKLNNLLVEGLVDGKDIATNAAMLNEAETINANWDNSANPWGDDEIVSTITRDSEWDTVAEIEAAISENLITASENNDDDVSGVELDDIFTSTGFLKRTGLATYTIDSIIDFSDETNATAGTGISITGDSISTTLGTAIDTTEIANGTVLATDLDSDTPANGEVLVYDSSTGGFQWTEPTGVGLTYYAAGTLLELAGTTFSIKEGTLTDEAICTYSSTEGLVCTTTIGEIDTDTYLSEDQVEAHIFDDDNTGTLESGTLALSSLSYTGTLPDTYLNSTITRDSEWDSISELETILSEDLITASENNDDDVSGVELDDIFTSTGFLKRTGLATYTIDSIIDFSDETNASAGDDIDFSEDSILLEEDIDLSILRASASAGLSVYDDGGNLGLFVQDGGNVGIGTTSPGEKLDIVGNAEINGNIIVTGTVDGRDLATDGSSLDSHTGDSDIHFAQSAISITASQVSDFNTSINNRKLSVFSATTSSELAGVISDETGTGVLVFANTPTLVTPEIGTATGTSLDLGGTSLFASRSLTVDTGGGFNIDLGTASGDDFSIDSTSLVIEGDTGKVGIGTTLPDGVLHVYTGDSTQTANSNADELILEGSGNSGLSILSGSSSDGNIFFGDSSSATIGAIKYSHSDDSIRLLANGAEALRIDSSGNVGIGTTVPYYKAQVNGTFGFTTGSSYRRAITPTYWGYNANYKALMIGSSSSTYSANDGAVTISFNYDPSINSNSVFTGDGREIIFRSGTKFVTPNSTDTAWNLNNLVLDDGNVGIGTTSPEGKLNIFESSAGVVSPSSSADGLVIESGSNSGLSFLTTDDNYASLIFGSPSSNGVGAQLNYRYNSNEFAIATNNANHFISLSTGNDAEAMRIDHSGNVGIGTTAPGAKLDVSSAKNNPNLILRTSAAMNTQDDYQGISFYDSTIETGRIRSYINDPAGGEEGLSFWTYDSPTLSQKMTILGNGNVGIGTTLPDGTLHVHTASAGTVAGIAGGENLVIEDSGDGGISILTPDASNSNVIFGSPSDNLGAQLKWNYDDGLLSIRTRKTGGEISLDSSDGVEALRIDSDGNVGIGTTAPETRLHVVDGIKQEVEADPTLEGSLIDSTNIDASYAVYVSGDYAYVASYNSDSLSVIDISDPANPVLAGALLDSTNMNGARAVYVSGNYAYVTGYDSDSLAIIDISDPTTPTLESALLDSTNINGASSVYVSGNYAYVTGVSSDSLAVIDISDPANPSVEDTLIDAINMDGSRAVYVAGNYAYVVSYNANSIAVVNVSDSSNLSLEDSLIDATNMAGPSAVYVSGKYAYITSVSSDSLAIVDVSDPADIALEGSLLDSTNLDYPSSIYISGKYAYIPAMSTHSLSVVDISDPTDPTFVSSLVDSTNMNNPRGVYVSGNYAYVAGNSGDSLAVVDINGAEFTSVFAGNIETGSLMVNNNAIVENDFYVRGSINAGVGGIYSQGTIASYVSSSDIPSALFMGGNVGIGTTSPTNTLQVNNEKGVYFVDGSRNFLAAGNHWSFRNYTQITDGDTTEAADYIHFWNDVWLDDSDLTMGHLYGIYNYVTLQDGTIGDNENMYGIWSGTRLNSSNGEITSNLIASQFIADVNLGTIGNDIYGLNLLVDVEPEATSIGGDVYGQRIWMDVDIDPTGTAYGLYMDLRTNLDYGVYQTGDIPNYFRGDVGIYQTSPSVALDVTGDIEYTGTITDVSDSRLKENMIPLEDSLEKITQLQAISFNMIDDEEKRVELGFTAQNVQEFFPEAVSIIDTEGHLGLAYDQLIAPTIHSIQTINSVVNVTDAPTDSPSIYIDENQNVGIGDTSPSYILTVDHNGDGTNVAYVNDSNAWTSGSADYAEYYKTTDKDLEAGEAVCIDITKENTVERCSRDGDSNIMGIVSTNPAFLGNAPAEERREDNSNYTVVAMLGQVPAKVSTENGEINPGDSLSSAETPGYLRKANPGESTVGVALEELDSTGTINVLISRKNKSLTVSEIEDKVTERVASMEIEDEVDLLVQDAINNLDIEDLLASFDERILTLEEGQTEDWIPVFTEITEELDAQSSYLDELTETIESTNDLVDYLTQKTLSRETRIQILEDQVAYLTERTIPDQQLEDDNIEFASLLEKENSTTLGALATNLSYEVDGDLFSFNLNGELEVTEIRAEKGEFERIEILGQTAGKATIEAGENEVLIECEFVTEDCNIIITPIGSTKGKVLYVDEIEENNGFKVRFDGGELEGDVMFSWMVVE